MFQVMDHHKGEHPVQLDLLLQASYDLIELCDLELQFLLALAKLLRTLRPLVCYSYVLCFEFDRIIKCFKRLRF